MYTFLSFIAICAIITTLLGGWEWVIDKIKPISISLIVIFAIFVLLSIANSESIESVESSEPIAPAPTALCNDWTLSYSSHHSGTCSHHNGVLLFF